MKDKKQAMFLIDRADWLQFQLAAKQNQSNASEVLRQFVDQYVSQKVMV